MRLTGRKAGLARASAPLVLLAALGIAFSAHGSSDAATAAPSCLGTGSARAARLPAAFPAPNATVFRTRTVRSGHVVVTARIPGTLRAARDFYASRLPRAGYRLFGGEAEQYEAETSFRGHGVAGRLKLNALPGCRAVALAVAFR